MNFITIARLRAWALLAAIAVVTPGCAPATLELKQVSIDEIDYGDDPGATVRRSLVSERDEAGMYAYRVRFPKGTRVDPHFHPENRIVTVINGSIYMGYGEVFDEEAMRYLEAGSIWSEPGNQPHYVWVKDEAVVIQIIGYGPSATIQVGTQN